MQLNIRVIPKAKHSKVDLPKVWTTAAAADGKANEAVIKLLAAHFGVAKSDIKIIRGTTSRDKIISIS
ncbi:MAG: DUF167 domain-containing protein [Rickettsiales bacterium]|jgi:uncharacterized protein YggU (UPF0235/DUF167 family)|nr:DUF167 domain-containing protein [Rickettsiales bacterium]